MRMLECYPHVRARNTKLAMTTFSEAIVLSGWQRLLERRRSGRLRVILMITPTLQYGTTLNEHALYKRGIMAFSKII